MTGRAAAHSQSRDDGGSAGSQAGPPVHPVRPGTLLIEGGFTHDALPDLFRYLCQRGESLIWELTTLAGTFTLIFDHGQPIDLMFRPVRPVGARVGLKALQILFRQEGGRFTVQRGKIPKERQTLHQSGEQLLIEMATLDDEAVAPAVMAGATFDLSAELALVEDLSPEEHQTAFRTSTRDVTLMDVLQLFSVNRQAFWIRLQRRDGGVAGRLLLAAGQVMAAEYGPLRTARAFTALLNDRDSEVIDVSPVRLSEWQEASAAETPLGTLDQLLMKEVLSGRLNTTPSTDTGDSVPVAPEDHKVPITAAPEKETIPQRQPTRSPGLLGRLFKRG